MFPFNLLKNIKPVTDTDEQLRVHILWFLLIRVILYTILLGISTLLHTGEQKIILPPNFFILIYIFLIYVFSIGSALLLQKSVRNLKNFARCQIIAETLFIALLVYATGGSQSIFTPIFILPVVASGLILYRNSALMTAATATLLYAVVLLLEFTGRVPDYFYESRYTGVESFLTGMNIFAVYGLTFFLIAMLSGILARRLRATEDALTRTELEFGRLLLLYKQIFDDIMTGIITIDDSNRITSINPAAEKITGFTEPELSGTLLQDIFPGISAATSERATADLTRKDGRRVRIGYSCTALNMPQEDATGETCTNCKVITLQDIGRIEQMERQMRKAEKMAAIGEMSASIAHDFRNPLAAISGSAQILSMEIAEGNKIDDSTRASLVDIILRESDRLAQTITDFLLYARPMNLDPQWFNLKKFCKKTAEAIQRESQFSDCRIKLDIQTELDICADRNLLQVALTHLLRNSCYAMADSAGTVCIRAIDEVNDETGKESILLEITDQGPGIDPSITERLFEPFFTTRDDATGMGLAIVQQVILRHQGTIVIDSSPDRGCTVRINLPLPDSTPSQS